MLNSTWVKTEKVQIQNMAKASCLKIDEMGRYLFVGTSTGLIQCFTLPNLKPIGEILTISTFGIHNIATYCPDIHEPINLIISMESGQVVLYKQISSDFTVTQNYMNVEE